MLAPRGLPRQFKWHGGFCHAEMIASDADGRVPLPHPRRHALDRSRGKHQGVGQGTSSFPRAKTAARRTVPVGGGVGAHAASRSIRAAASPGRMLRGLPVVSGLAAALQ